jgi:hypothetical protein
MKAFKSFFKDIDTSINYDPEELKRGIEIELEHTNYKAIATIIAKHHLAEDPHYYTKLKKVESAPKSEDEERSCWKGYHKEGMKMKGGRRVNNCVKNSSEDAEDIHKPVRPGILKRQVSGKMTCSKARALKSKQKNKGNNTAKAAQRYLNYHC